MLVVANGLCPCQGPRRLSHFVLSLDNWNSACSERAILKGWTLSAYSEIILWRRYRQPRESGLVSGVMECTRGQPPPPPRLQVRRSPNQRLMVEKVWKNGYPFDLSQVCHLVDIPITSKIKRVCLNIIPMLALGTKGQTADHDPLTVINSASDLVTFPVYSAINLPVACHHSHFLLLRRF